MEKDKILGLLIETIPLLEAIRERSSPDQQKLKDEALPRVKEASEILCSKIRRGTSESDVDFWTNEEAAMAGRECLFTAERNLRRARTMTDKSTFIMLINRSLTEIENSLYHVKNLI